MKKIALVGEWNSSNLGDNLLCNCVKKTLETNNNYIITEFDISTLNYNMDSNKPTNFDIKPSKFKKIVKKFIPSSFIHYYISKKAFKNFKKRLLIFDRDKYDYIIFAGGQMFMWYFSIPIYEIVSYAKKNEIPVCFNACGVGINDSVILRRKLRKALNSSCVKYISSRDNNLYLTEQLKIRKEIHKVIDTGICCSKYYQKNKKNTDLIGIGVMYLENKSMNELIDFWKLVIDKLIVKKEKVEIFCNGNNLDFIVAKDVYEKFYKNNPNVILSDKPNNSYELVNIISKYKRIISMRLHSIIIACSFEIPVTAIFWDNKVNLFLEKIQDAPVVLNMDQIISNEKEVYLYGVNKKNIIPESICRIESEINLIFKKDV